MRVRRSLAAATAATAAVGLMVVAAPAAQAAPALPSEFVLIDTPAGQAAGDLTDAAYLPDGSVLTTGRLGSVSWLPPGGQPSQIASIPVFAGGSLGLTSIAVAPDYATSRTVYTTQAVATSTSTQVLRVSKWRAEGSEAVTGLSNESVVLEIPANADSKGIQDIAADSSGSILWVAVGDNATVRSPAGATKDNVDKLALRALDPAQPTGKILRVYTDGRGVEDNPFYDQVTRDSWRSRNYLSGLRDPRITLDPRGGVIVTDTGWAARDEVNIALPGQNMKWPCWEGTTKTPGYKDLPECANVANSLPLTETVHGAADTVIGGLPYTGTSYPEIYRGVHFLANRGAQTLSTLVVGTNGTATQPPTGIATAIGDPVSLATAPNGDIVLADAATSSLRRLTYKPANQAPSAAFDVVTTPAARKASFDASASMDPDFDVLNYQWAFGDGTTADGRSVEHTYANGDPVTVTLTVRDVHGATKTNTQVIVPTEATPTVSIKTQGTGTLYSASEPVSLGASGEDAADGPLTVSWTATRVHCPRNSSCEVSAIRTGTGPTFALPFAADSDSRVEITAYVVNGRNVTGIKRYTAAPRLSRLRVSSTHPARIRVDTHGAVDRLVTVGAQVLIAAPESSLGKTTFTKWTDNLSAEPTRQIVMPTTDLTLRADYVSPIQKRYADEAPLRTLVGTPVGLELIEGGSRWQLYTSGRLYWTEGYGVSAVSGEILTKYVTLGAHSFLGAPITDERVARAGNGRYNDFVGGPTTGAGSIYWTSSIGAMAISGSIRVKWVEANAEAGPLGFPTTDELSTPDGVGRVNHFFKNNASIYWTAATGAHYVMGQIWQKWGKLGYEKFFGYPTTDEVVAADGVGRYTHFSGNGSIYWTPSTAAFELHGSIRDRFRAIGAEAGVGYPTTDETWVPGNAGKYNHFIQGGFAHSIYWRANTNNGWEVKGLIRLRWRDLGWETSYLGFPTSGEYNTPTGKRSDFQFGYITYNGSTGAIEDRRY